MNARLTCTAAFCALALLCAATVEGLRLRQHHENRDEDASASSAMMERVTVKNAEERRAVANDGSPQVFYYLKGSIEKEFVFYLEGGWYCFNEVSCKERWAAGKEMMSSKTRPPTMKPRAYVNNDCLKNQFCNANLLYVAYVTSDSYIGDSSTNETGMPWQFRGRPALKAVFEDMFDGINVSGTMVKIPPGSKILLSGGSAGAIGVLWNANFIGELVRSRCPTCTFKALSDSGFFVGTLDDPLSPRSICNVTPVECQYPYEVQMGYKLWNAQLDPTCAADFKDTPYKCMYGEIATLYVREDIFLSRFLYDFAEMTADNILDLLNVTAIEVMTQIIATVRTVLSKFPSFVPSCGPAHEMYNDQSHLTADGVLYGSALSLWYNLDVKKAYKDKCTGLHCRHCPYDP